MDELKSVEVSIENATTFEQLKKNGQVIDLTEITDIKIAKNGTCKGCQTTKRELLSSTSFCEICIIVALKAKFPTLNLDVLAPSDYVVGQTHSGDDCVKCRERVNILKVVCTRCSSTHHEWCFDFDRLGCFHCLGDGLPAIPQTPDPGANAPHPKQR